MTRFVSTWSAVAAGVLWLLTAPAPAGPPGIAWQVWPEGMADARHRLIPVLADRVVPDPAIARLIDDLYAPYREPLARVVGETRSVLYRRDLYGGTTDAFMVRAYREIGGAEIGLAPGWRFGATLLPGPVRAEDVHNVMKATPTPLYAIRLSGRQILEILEDNRDNVFNADPLLLLLGGDVVRVAGLQVWFRRRRPKGERIGKILVNGAPMDEDRRYAIATSGTRAWLRDPGARASARPAAEELIAYIRDRSPIQSDAQRAFTEVT